MLPAAPSLAALVLSLAGCVSNVTVEPPTPPAAPAVQALAAAAPSEPSMNALVERAMPAVVLLVSTRADGKVTYGAGMIVQPSLVLTSRHVVANARSIRAMLYRAGRSTYTPMDGGLSRFLFENQADLVAAEEVAGDDTSDLALVHVAADTTGVPLLTLATDAVKPGDRVFALGHPQETVWSFTQGVVGAIQQGAIQHDAIVSHGSSGGPLLNTRGQVVGINVAKVVSENDGLAFARPIALASRYLGESRLALAPLDMSTPESSAVSCWRGQEIGRVEVGDCFDWDDAWRHGLELRQEAIRLAPDAATRTRIAAEDTGPAAKQRFIDEGRRHVSGFFVNPAESCDMHGAVPAPLRAEKAELDRREAALVAAHPELRGVRSDMHDPALMKARLRLGIRVGRVARSGELAWVELVGRNGDGTLYKFSELYAHVGDRWLQRSTSTLADEAKLPRDFAPPFETYADYRVHKLSWLLRDPASSGASQKAVAGPAASVSSPAQRGSGDGASSSVPADAPACTTACDHPSTGSATVL